MSEDNRFQWRERHSIENFVGGRFGHSSMLLGRLTRAATNQVDVANLAQDDEEICRRLNVTMSRYAIWAQTAATTLKTLCNDSSLRSEDLASLKEVEASLRAFVVVQEKFIGYEVESGR